MCSVQYINIQACKSEKLIKRKRNKKINPLGIQIMVFLETKFKIIVFDMLRKLNVQMNYFGWKLQTDTK